MDSPAQIGLAQVSSAYQNWVLTREMWVLTRAVFVGFNTGDVGFNKGYFCGF